ncbi:MAG: penicillin-binding protein 2 [Phycisphaerales bacterium]|nr:penicillin-binding protein 2 [Phycisphaerales bacterium]
MRWSGILVAVVALLLTGGAGRLAYIAATEGESLRQRAERQQRTSWTIPARRGEILDTRGRVLAGTTRRPSVFVDPGLVPDALSARFAATSVAPVLGMKPEELERDLRTWSESEVRFKWLKRAITADEVAALERVVSARRLRAFIVQEEPQREYPQGTVATQLLGFVGPGLRGSDGREVTTEMLQAGTGAGRGYEDLIGRAGIEAMYDAVLAGRPGRRSVVVDVGRRTLVAAPEAFEPARDGGTVYLTIDAYIQQIVQRHLARAYREYRPAWVAGVVIDPQSGEVLAMATVPFLAPDQSLPEEFAGPRLQDPDGPQALWRNRVVTDSYEPGSIFKPFVAALAVEEGVARLDEVFPIGGAVHNFGRRQIRDTHPHGPLPLHQIISKSSNIGMGMVGARVGMERLHRYVRSFGFGDVTGIGLPGEHTGLVQSFDKWNPSFSPQSIPIGQEIAVTPLQMVSAFSTFCNGGILYRPRIIRGVVGPDGETLVDNSEPVAIRRVLSEKTSREFRLRALVETVTEGTAHRTAKLEEWQVFGKTGTAQVAGGRGRGYLPGQYIGSFIAGAPSDHPRVVVLVSVYLPDARKAYYGGVVAAPVVRDIIADVLTYMRVPRELPEVVSSPARRR